MAIQHEISEHPLISGRGAVLSGLSKKAAITSTVATKHYGVAVDCLYNEREDAGQPTTIHKFSGKKRVSMVSNDDSDVVPISIM